MNLAFVIEEFPLQSPAQQLLDRFLIGYARNGAFHRPDVDQIIAHHVQPPAGELVQLRITNHGLRRTDSLSDALKGADAVALVWKGAGANPNEVLLRQVLDRAPSGCRCFVHGLLANSRRTALELAAMAEERNIALCSGTPLAVTWHLPPVDLPPGTPLREALVVVQGPPDAAEFEALESLLPVIGQRSGGEAGVRSVTQLKEGNLGLPGKNDADAAPLLAAAISRSDTPQGAPVEDGRTQDLVGLGLVPNLARHPRGWQIEHQDGFRTRILVLDGVIADYNFAVATERGDIISAQVYRAPGPAREHFSRLAAVMEDYFATGNAPWAIDRSLLEAELMQQFREA